MAGTTLLSLIDDIAALLDDIAVMSKVAAKKTAGVLADDLALNAQQVAGVSAQREIPVIWAVAKGSFLNKLILVPVALLISVFAPWLILPLLMIGGAYLCFEGAEKVVHHFWHKEDHLHPEEVAQIDDLVAHEKDKIRGAIRTDFILSAEIIVISLGTLAGAAVAKQLAVLSVIAIGMTIGVYGLVAGIVKIDDLGLKLIAGAKDEGFSLRRSIGNGLLSFAPKLMKFLSIAGSAAMFLVGGGIIAHGIPYLHHLAQDLTTMAQESGGAVAAFIAPTLFNAVVGVLAGLVLVALLTVVQKVRGK